MYKTLITNLKNNDVQFSKGLTNEEIRKIKETYNIILPIELKNIYMEALPISKGFYNWRDFSIDNINLIKNVMNMPFNNISEDSSDIEWGDSWGVEPQEFDERNKIIISKLGDAPKLIPIYGHRYQVSTNLQDNPVFSVYGTDIICYGQSLEEYFYKEFIDTAYNEINYVAVNKIPFWGEIL